MITGYFHVFLLSFDNSDHLCKHLPKLRKAPGSLYWDAIKSHFTRWGELLSGLHLIISLSKTYFFETLSGNDSTARGLTVSRVCKASERVLGLLTVRVSVKDTIGIPPWISPMTQFCCLAWALHTVALPCLSRDIWPPSKSSSQTSNHFICSLSSLLASDSGAAIFTATLFYFQNK